MRNGAAKRRRHSAQFKTKVGLAALRDDLTQGQLASEFGVNPLLISHWKKQVVDALPAVFGQRAERSAEEQAELERQLYVKIRRLEIELGWLKKKVGPLT